ncbi:hypothetical protein D3Z36_01640 [Lachnospiraceae bacterium]|nr:hypothetical protein [Lachnospiraceae bacterium]
MQFRHSLLANAFGVKLREVFTESSTCASHLPAAFCRISLQLLVPVTAIAMLRPIIGRKQEFVKRDR